ncbi:reverse transcriptase domain-containing protein [candidate division CSSED10-310 bacterium]|uniref:Reverse transcriptase domain-containing protein n=1 Tax=candidate division CSSED10-310 bacterium TaxID=2855610 RepID=A0ABV6Z339_UNCC1
MKRATKLFDRITSFSVLIASAHKACRRKRSKRPVIRFLFDLEPEILSLQHDLLSGRYGPGEYTSFTITDPKERLISAAPFRDRVLHHAITTGLEPILERRFITHSYACRRGKGTHAALRQAQSFSRRNRYFLKCDIRKFYQSIDHDRLKSMLRGLNALSVHQE